MNEPNTVAPPPPPDEPTPGRLGNAWERRGEVGFLQGLVGACKDFITAPGRTWEETRQSGDVASPLLFAVLIGVVTAFIGQLWAMLIGTSMMSMMPAEIQEGLGMFVATSGAGLITSLVIVPIVTVIAVFVWGAILHVMLMLVGGLDASEAGFEGSLRVVCYSSIGNIAKVIPVIGGMISMIWMVVLMVLGVARLHGTTEGKAVAAVLLPLLVCCVCIVGFMMVGVGAMMSGLAE